MAYLGNSPVLSQQEYRNIDNISGSFNGSTTSFALLVNGVAPVPAPQSSNQCLISVNGVVQKPDDTGATGFRISGGNIIFSSAPTSGQSFFGVILAGADYIYAGQNFPDGTVSAPSITFNQDLDTGFFRSGAGEIKYTANGTAVVTLSSNNLTAASFIPTSSSAPTNGIYLPAANSVGITTNSSERLRINSSGNVGIGTTSPLTLLDVRQGTNRRILFTDNASYASNGIVATNDSGGEVAIAIGGSPIQFIAGSTERARIDSSGRLLVGTSSARTAAIGGSNQVVFEAAANYFNTIFASNNNTPDSSFLSFIKSRGTTSGSHTIVANGDDLGVIDFEGADGSVARSAARITAQVDGTPGSGDMPGRLVFSTTADGASSPTERMRINSSGQIITTGTFVDPAITGTILEDIYTITDGAAFEVDPGNGSVQLITLGASRTPKATNFAAGESVTLMVADGTAYTLTWTDSTWGSGGVVWVGGSAPTLATTGYTVIQFWKVSTQVYGARVGDVA